MCGQENNNNNISFGKLITEFFNNYLSFDSRFTKSIIPFFFKPGNLTNQFNKGLRVTYVNPVRLYLVVSLFYFFVFQVASRNFIERQAANLRDLENEVNLDNIEGVGDSTRVKLSRVLDQEMIKDINRGLSGKTIGDFLDRLDDSSKFKIIKALDSAELVAFEREGLSLDSLNLNPVRNFTLNLGNQTDTIAMEGDSVKLTGNPRIDKSVSNWQKVEKYKDDRNVSDQMLYDSLSTESNNGFTDYLWKQYIRVRRSDKMLITNYIVENLPLMMLFLLPVFALILKLLYIRQKILYIKHLIHALHLHSFAYIAYGVAILLIIYLSKGEALSNWISFITFSVVSTYAYISFLRVYRQGKIKTFVKFNLVGFIYINFLSFFFVIELFISFLLY